MREETETHGVLAAIAHGLCDDLGLSHRPLYHYISNWPMSVPAYAIGLPIPDLVSNYDHGGFLWLDPRDRSVLVLTMDALWMTGECESYDIRQPEGLERARARLLRLRTDWLQTHYQGREPQWR